MMLSRSVTGGLLALVTTVASADAQPSTRPVKFPPGANAITLKGTISGRSDQTYIVTAISGQTLLTLFSPTNTSCYFNVFEPGTETAAHVGSSSGNEFGQNPTMAGQYRIQVYLMRSAARRNETCRYSLSIELTGAPGGSSASVSDPQMRDRCKGEAAPMYSVLPLRIKVGRVRSVAAGFEIDGTANKGAEGVKKLRCIFKHDRTFSHIMAMTPDGK
jgi:hypothetical protein